MSYSESPLTEMAPRRLAPAWLISFVFHFSAIVLLAFTIKPIPPAFEGRGGSLGIVLASRSGDKDLFDDEGGAGGSAEILPEAPPVDILAALPSDTQPTETTPTEPVEQSAYAEQPASAVAATQASSTPIASSLAHAAQSTGASNLGNDRGRGTGAARVSVFGVEGQGRTFLYLFDRSSSMDGAPLASAKRQLLDSLAALEGSHQFHVIFFNTKVLSLDVVGGGRRIAFADDRNKQLAANFVGGVTAEGGTDRLSALREAIRFGPDVIFFLTDADDPMSPGELADIARENSRAQAAICVIEFGRRQSPLPGNFLTELARQSGGQYGYVNTATLRK